VVLLGAVGLLCSFPARIDADLLWWQGTKMMPSCPCAVWCQANLMQLTVMAPPSLGKGILYLSTDERLLALD